MIHSVDFGDKPLGKAHSDILETEQDDDVQSNDIISLGPGVSRLPAARRIGMMEAGQMEFSRE